MIQTVQLLSSLSSLLGSLGEIKCNGTGCDRTLPKLSTRSGHANLPVAWNYVTLLLPGLDDGER